MYNDNMCLAIPGKIVDIKDNGENALVDFDGIQKEINLSLVKNAGVGEFVIVHSGFAIQKLTKEDADEVFKLHVKSHSHSPSQNQN